MIHTRLLCSPKAGFTLCICYNAFHVNKQVNTKIFNSKNVQHYIYVLNLRTWSCASWLQCSWKIFSTESIYCEYVLYVVRKNKDNNLPVFSNRPTPEVFIHTVSRAKFKLLFTDTLNLLFCRHTTKWMIKGKLVFDKLGWIWSLVKISLFFLGSLCG